MKKVITLVAALALALIPATAFAQASDGKVTVVHGVPDLTVDVYVNDALTLEDFTYGTVTDELTLPAGDYNIKVFAANADPSSDSPAVEDDVTLPGGANATIVAHLQEGGAPTLTTFVNDISALDAGEARVTARHVADFGAVDVLANDGPLFTNVTNPQEGVADVPAGTYNVKITVAGDASTVAFDQDLTLAEGTNSIAYAIGSVSAGNFAVVLQAIGGLHSTPSGVPTGTAGLADSGISMWMVAAMALTLTVALGGAAVAVRREN